MKKERLQYNIIELPVKRWKEYQAIRLEALKKEPAAFAASYSETAAQPPLYWKKRLTSSLEGKTSKLFFVETNGILVGMIGILFSVEEKLKHSCTLVAFYVRKTYRGNGVGDALLKHAIQYIKSVKSIVRIDSAVHEGQDASRAVQLKNGFKEIGTAHRSVKVKGKYYNSTRLEIILR